jgi:hypothetical protein
MKRKSTLSKTGNLLLIDNRLQIRLVQAVTFYPYLRDAIYRRVLSLALFVAAFMLITANVQAQTSMVKWSFGFSNTPTSNVAINSGKLVTVAGAASGFASGVGFPTDPVYVSSSGWNNGAGNSWWLINFSSTNYTGLTINFRLGTFQFGPKDFKMQYSTSSASGPWTDQGFTVAFGAVGASGAFNSYTQSLPVACENQTNVWVRFVTTSATASAGGGAVIDEVEITGTASCAAPAVSAHPPNRTICAGANTTFPITATGDGLTYQWQENTGSGFANVSNGGVFSGATSATLTITGATSGMSGYLYRCAVTGTCGNATSNNCTLTVNAQPTAFNVTGGGGYCTGGSGLAVGLSGSQSGVNYQLFRGATSVGSAVAGTGAAISFGTQTTGGIYTVTATNATTTCTNNMTGSVSITVNSLPTTFNITGGGGYCSGGTGVAIGLSGSESGVNYQLFRGATSVGSPVSGTGSSISFGNQTTAGTYTVTATNATTSCANNMTGSVSVTMNSLPSTFNVTGGGTLCSGATGVAVGLSGSESGVNYQLFRGATSVGSAVAGTGSAISFGNQTTAGTYTVVATNTTTTCTNTMTGSATVTVNALPTAFNITGGGGYCTGGTGLAIGLSGSQSGVNYQLFRGATSVGSAVAGTGSSISFGIQATAGTYTVTATNTTTSCTNNMTGSVSITVNSLPTAFNVTGGGGYCSGGSGAAVGLSGSQSGVNYQLFRGATSVGSAVAGTGSAISFGNQTTAGTYTVTATNTTTTCTNNMTGSVSVTVNSLPTIFNATGGGFECGIGAPIGVSGSQVGVNYQVFYTDDFLAPIIPPIDYNIGSAVAGTGSALSLGNVNYNGFNYPYKVRATNATTGCTALMNGNISVMLGGNTPLAYSVTGGGTYCSGSGPAIGLNGSEPNITYQLYRGATPVGSPVAGGFGAISFGNQATAGTYTVIATSTTFGCTKTQNGSATVTLGTPPTAFNVTGGGAYCTGGSGVAVGLSNSQTGVNYQLFRGTTSVGSAVAGTGSALSFGSHTTAGVYTVVATNATISNCTTTMTGDASVMIINNTTWYQDTDGDGFGNGGVTQTACAKPSGYVQNDIDCNDNAANTTTWSNVGNAGFSAANANGKSIAIDGNSIPYVVYPDSANGYKATAMKYNGSNWVVVGSAGFSAGIAGQPAIKIDGSGIPYVAFIDGNNSDKLTVMKYNGSNWVFVGSAGFSTQFAGWLDLAIDAGGTPYVGFSDWGNGSRASVMKYNGSNWVVVGNAGFTSANINYMTLKFDGAGAPHVAVREIGSGDGKVIKFDGSSWVTVGGGAFAADPIEITLAIDDNGTPYAAYRDQANGHKASVKKYNGSSWVPVGSLGFSAATALSVSIAVDATGSPIVAYDDASFSPRKITTMKFNGTSWVAIGTVGFSVGTSSEMAINSKGIPYVAFNDGNNGNRATVMKMQPQSLGNPTTPTLSATATSIASGGSTTLSINTGTLNDASSWKWYSGSCGGTAVGTGTSITVSPTAATTYFARGEGSCLGAPGSCGSIAICVNPTITLGTNPSVCAGVTSASLPYTATTQSPDKYSIVWDATALTAGFINVSDATLPSSPITLTIPGAAAAATYNGTLTVKNAAGCVSTGTSITVTIKPIPTVNAVANQALCNGVATAAVNFSGAVSGTTYNWTNNTTSIGLAASGSGNIGSFTATNSGAAPVTATITVTPTANGCTGTAGSFTITVNPTPTVNAVANQTRCNGTATAAVSFSGAVSGTTFAWTNNTTSIGLAASGTGNIGSFTATNTGTAPVTATIVVTPSANGCTGSTGTYTYTVNPTPTVNAVSNQTRCNGTATAAVNFGSPVSGTTYAWTNNTTSIGLAASGSGNIGSFTATNTGTAPVTATVTVTPTANSCTGPDLTYTYTVNPTPTVNAVSSQTRCNGTATAAVNFGSPVSGTTYAWTNNTTSIGLGASGSGNIGSFTATNTGTAPVTATVTVTPTANSCTGPDLTYAYTVNPTPTVNTVANQTRCNGAATAAVNFGSPVTGTTYAWTNNTTSIGLGASGSGNIASFTATNTGTAPVTATITITPTANSCTGPDQTYTYTVNPTPTVNTVANQTRCNGAATAAVNFGSPVSGTTYAWTNNTTSIGLAASGSGNIGSFTATNTGTAPVVATVTITPTANSCTGPNQVYTYTVNPTPTVNAISDQTVCNGASTAVVNFSSPVAGTTYSWTNNLPSVGLSASGTGNINAFSATNLLTIPVMATIIVTPSANGCTGINGTFNYTVNPTPLLTSVLTAPSICNNTMFSYTPTGSTAGTTFAWSRAVTAGISNPAASGTNSPNEILVNTSPDSVVVTYMYTLTANSCVNTYNVAVTVYPSPKLSGPIADTICSEQEFTYVPASLTKTTVFAWSRAVVPGITPSTGSGTNSIYETLTNNTSNTIQVTYVYTLTAFGCSNNQVVTLTVHPLPKAPVITIKPPTELCAETEYQNMGAETLLMPGVAYSWETVNATIHTKGTANQNIVVSFPKEGTARIILTATYTNTGCKQSSVFDAIIKPDVAQKPEVIYVNKRFVCLRNDMSLYRWGYDDKATLDSAIIPNETNQDYLNANPDFNNRHYWVITLKNGCIQKTYYNAPADVQTAVMKQADILVYPNPAYDLLNLEVNNAGSTSLQFRISDMTGRVIKTAQGTKPKTQLDISSLAQGVYTIDCLEAGTRIGTAKFIKY